MRDARRHRPGDRQLLRLDHRLVHLLELGNVPSHLAAHDVEARRQHPQLVVRDHRRLRSIIAPRDGEGQLGQLPQRPGENPHDHQHQNQGRDHPRDRAEDDEADHLLPGSSQGPDGHRDLHDQEPQHARRGDRNRHFVAQREEAQLIQRRLQREELEVADRIGIDQRSHQDDQRGEGQSLVVPQQGQDIGNQEEQPPRQDDRGEDRLDLHPLQCPAVPLQLADQLNQPQREQQVVPPPEDPRLPRHPDREAPLRIVVQRIPERPLPDPGNQDQQRQRQCPQSSPARRRLLRKDLREEQKDVLQPQPDQKTGLNPGPHPLVPRRKSPEEEILDDPEDHHPEKAGKCPIDPPVGRLDQDREPQSQGHKE